MGNFGHKPALAILGAGSWGTALALSAARQAQSRVVLWDHNPKHCQTLLESRENKRYLPGIMLPDNVCIMASLAAVIDTTNTLLIAVPSYVFRELLRKIKQCSKQPLRILWATKGLEPETACLMHQIVAEELGAATPVAVISGPTFAKEVANGLPTAITLASPCKVMRRDIAHCLHTPTFRVYTSEDMVGVEYGGAIKNILAIATGIADGLGYSANTRAALITRGLQEVIKIGTAMGGKAETFMGLAGLGDLILTCTDNQSRNRQFGLALAKGQSVEQAQKNIGQAIEGYRTAKEIFFLAQKKGLDTPIIAQIYQVLYQQRPPLHAVNALLEREPKAE